MRKFLKIFFIVILVAVAVAGTCFIFYKNLKRNEPSDIVLDYIKSNDNVTFTSSLDSVNNKMLTKSDSRMELIITTHDNLESIANTLATYMVMNSSEVNDEIETQLSNLKKYRISAESMINEFNIKYQSYKFSEEFANDLYEEMCRYLVSYSRLVSAMNDYISTIGVNVDVDIKYSIFDIYANIVYNEFSNVVVVDKAVSHLESRENIDYIHDELDFELKNHYLNINSFSMDCSEFVTYYNKCNHVAFSTNFKQNMRKTISVDTNTTNEDMAVYYLQKVYGKV